MKANKIIKRLVYDPSLAEQGYVVTIWDKSHRDEYFGTAGYEWKGHIEYGEEYFYLVIDQSKEADTYRLMGELPDAYCERPEGDIVAVWKVD